MGRNPLQWANAQERLRSFALSKETPSSAAGLRTGIVAEAPQVSWRAAVASIAAGAAPESGASPACGPSWRAAVRRSRSLALQGKAISCSLKFDPTLLIREAASLGTSPLRDPQTSATITR